MSGQSEFAGVIGRFSNESTPWWEPAQSAAPGSPNVAVLVLDDVGFAHLGCYGSTIDTPNMDRLAAGGLLFNNFHTTTLCSPSRACLLTGRNHHSVGMGSVANSDLGFPSRRGSITPAAGTLAQYLRANGYATFAAGKWHIVPPPETSAAGPFHGWPLGKGFDRYYGFLDALTDQYTPELVEDNHHIEPPGTDGYHLTDDLVERAIGMVRDQKSVRPEQPFFLYLAFGACHAPHQAPVELREKYRGRFDAGWDVVRQGVFERQKALGIIPAETELAARNAGVVPWAELDPDQQRVAARFQESFAAMLDHTDSRIGHFLDSLAEIGQLDNTLLFLVSDNGASQEGGVSGTVNEYRHYAGLPPEPAENLARIDEIGTATTFSNYPWGWAQVGNTPLKRYKQNTHGGGIRDPFLVHWPAGISGGGAVRTQFHHITDVTPTILEICGITVPDTFQGVPQKPLEGVSMAYTFADGAAKTHKRTQYFEMWGHRAIWHDGWKAVTFHPPGSDPAGQVWELYHLDEDFSECHDLAEAQPEKLREMVDRWWIEAARYDVLPLTPVVLGQGPAQGPRPGTIQDRREFVYYPGTSRIPSAAAADTRNRSHAIVVRIDRPSAADEGVLLAHGLQHGGYTLYIKANRLAYEYNFVGTHYGVESEVELAPGPCELRCEFTSTGNFAGRVHLFANGKEVGAGDIPHTMPSLSISSLSIGADPGTAVSNRYRAPFTFTGRIHEARVLVEGDGSGSEAADRRAAITSQ